MRAGLPADFRHNIFVSRGRCSSLAAVQQYPELIPLTLWLVMNGGGNEIRLAVFGHLSFFGTALLLFDLLFVRLYERTFLFQSVWEYFVWLRFSALSVNTFFCCAVLHLYENTSVWTSFLHTIIRFAVVRPFMTTRLIHLLSFSFHGGRRCFFFWPLSGNLSLLLTSQKKQQLFTTTMLLFLCFACKMNWRVVYYKKYLEIIVLNLILPE